MKTIYLKLAASFMSILVAFTMVIGASYAWLTLSKSPVVNGINVSIGGGKTIMLAADITKTVTDAAGNEITVHYPGEFSNSLDFARYETYDYLAELSGLSPVSTADGVYWILPEYDEDTGMLKKFSEFVVDEMLDNANVTENKDGSYIFLDFWIVSPGAEYNVRVSTDIKNNTGSYLIELPGVEEDENGHLRLAETEGIIESIARVGFLVNKDIAGSEGMNAYVESADYNTRYKSLLGVYQEKGEKAAGEYQFTIYEPNATKHPSENLNDGDYIITNPLCYNPHGNTILEEDISSKLMVQTDNTWKTLDSGSQFEQIFQAAIANKGNLNTEAAASVFYNDYLQGQIGVYVKCGNFYQETAALYSAAENGVVNADSMNLNTAGAADDVVITKLKANTPQRIRMYIWLEGQDADCTNNASVGASGFSLNIELSGADQ